MGDLNDGPYVNVKAIKTDMYSFYNPLRKWPKEVWAL
jgi:hypothetical protein